MASNEEEDHNALIDDEDIEDDDDDEEDLESDFEEDEDDQPLLKEEEVLHSFPLPTISTPTPLQSNSSSVDPKRQRITPSTPNPTPTTTIITHPSFSSSLPIPTPIHEEEKKPSAFDDSRRLFQRLWTDEDEIGLLQGFLDYTSQRGGFKNSAYHHDTAPFYDQIKSRLQLDFNKNQLVEKLRRLKKKYRNVMSRINSGKDVSFKTPHDQATFEISRKIWSGIGGVGETALMDDEEQGNHEINGTHLEKKVSASSSRSRKRSRSRAGTAPALAPAPAPIPVAGVVAEENVPVPTNLLNCPVNSSLPNVIEDTVRSCLTPLFKEFMSSAINGPGSSRGFGGMASNLLPLNFGGNLPINFLNGEKEIMDEKWRKQQILELEVYSKRVELVQDQIKLALEELRSTGSK